MRLLTILGTAVILVTSALGRISDEEAIARARAYVASIGTEVGQKTPIVYPHPYADAVIVSLDGFVSVRMNLDGSFRMFSDGRRKPPASGPAHFRDDEEAWRRAEQIVARLDPPPGLQRHTIKYMRETTDVIHCQFDVRPYGYWSEAGNCASVSFQKSDGAVLHVIVGRGWQYEPPNIRVSAQEARSIASSRMGGDPSEWEYVIKYAKSTPDLKRRGVEKTQRLVYSLFRPSNRDGIIIDTVTGDVVADLRASDAAPTETLVSRAIAEEPLSQGLTAPSRKRSSSSLLLPSAAAAIALGIALWFGRRLVSRH